VYGVRIRVAYDGTRFNGWQVQPGQRTVQEELERAVEQIAGERYRVFGCSRTDSGVHALGQVAAFDTPRQIEMFKWVRGLNGGLPQDVAVLSAEPCEAGYNPRYHSTGKTYRYLLHLGPIRDPLLTGRAWHLGPRRARSVGAYPKDPADWLDVEAMRAAAEAFVGTHDFRAFKTSRDPREQTVRTLTRVDVIERFADRDDLLAIEVRGTAFLHNMVRILVGTLVEVGRDKRAPAEIAEVIAAGDRAGAGETAPPDGLYLVEIELGR